MNNETRFAPTASPADPNFRQAEQFLNDLDQSAKRFTFQAFDDVKQRRDPRLARILHGPFVEHAAELARLNSQGAGIFVCINATDLKGRGTSHITGARAVWQDDDAQWSGELPLIPSISVRTSEEKFQRYWLCDRLPLAEHRAVMERISRDFGNDPNAKDLSRVLRLPGFWHRKNPNEPHLVRIVGGNRQKYCAAQILAAFPPLEKPPAAPPRRWCPRTDDDRRIRDALRRIPADDRETWWRVGMALRGHYGEAGRAVWDEWSATSQKCDAKVQERVWRSFRRSGLTIRTVFYFARVHARAA